VPKAGEWALGQASGYDATIDAMDFRVSGGVLAHARFRGNSEKHLLVLRITGLDPAWPFAR
jgi:hypothetical protein